MWIFLFSFLLSYERETESLMLFFTLLREINTMSSIFYDLWLLGRLLFWLYIYFHGNTRSQAHSHPCKICMTIESSVPRRTRAGMDACSGSKPLKQVRPTGSETLTESRLTVRKWRVARSRLTCGWPLWIVFLARLPRPCPLWFGLCVLSGFAPWSDSHIIFLLWNFTVA